MKRQVTGPRSGPRSRQAAPGDFRALGFRSPDPEPGRLVTSVTWAEAPATLGLWEAGWVLGPQDGAQAGPCGELAALRVWWASGRGRRGSKELSRAWDLPSASGFQGCASVTPYPGR